MMKIEEMGFTTRLVNILTENGISDSKALMEEYGTGRLFEIRGLGKKAVGEINVWLLKNKNKNKNNKNNKNKENEQ